MVLRATLVLAAVSLVACGSDSPTSTEPNALNLHAQLPSGYVYVGQVSADYSLGIDNVTTHSGHAALGIVGINTKSPYFRGVGQQVKADAYRGKRIRLTGWVRTQNVQGPGAVLWMRVDAQNTELAFDNMNPRPIVGTTDWQQVQIILDVPANAVGIIFGAFMVGSGEMFVDDFALDIIPATGPTTDLLTGPVDFTPYDAITVYANAQTAPVNLDFEK